MDEDTRQTLTENMSGVNWRVIDRPAKQTLEMPLDITKLKPSSSVVYLDDARRRSEIAIENKNWGERPGQHRRIKLCWI